MIEGDAEGEDDEGGGGSFDPKWLERVIEEERNAVASTLIKTHYYYIESAIQ